MCRAKIGNHPQLSFEQLGLECLQEADAAANNGDALGLKFALARARCYLPPGELEVLRMQNNFCFTILPVLSDPRLEEVHPSRTRSGFADVH